MINNTEDPTHLVKSIVATLGGYQSSSNQASVHCPAHDDKHPSCSVAVAGDKILVKCHAGCSQGAVVEKFKELGLWPHKPSGFLSIEKISRQITPLISRSNTPAHKYLLHRGLAVSDLPQSLGYHPSLEYFDKDRWVGELPALVATISNLGGEVVSIHRTYLRADGQKAPVKFPKKMLGKTAGHAVHLGTAANSLSLTEGIETGLAVRQATGMPVWATLSASGMKAVQLPPSVSKVSIWADLDINSVGIKAAKTLASRLVKAGLNVFIHVPKGPIPEGEKGVDWLDVLNLHGPSAFSESIETTEPWVEPLGSDLVVCLHDVVPEKVEFLCNPYLPLGKVTLLIGDPGIGKSWIALSLARDVSLGRGCFGVDSRRDPGNVVVLNAEDGLADTIKARLEDLGGDQRRIFAPKDPIAFDAGGFSKIEEIIRSKRPALVIIDPIQAYLGGDVDANRHNQVRAKLNPLVHLAKEYQCAILVVGHLNKDGSKKPLYRTIGSIDFAAAARSVLLVGCDPEDQDQRAVFHIKSNLGVMGEPVGYSLEDSVFRWIGSTDLTLSRVLASPNADASFGERRDRTVVKAEDFLKEALRDGPLKSAEVFAKGAEMGTSRAAVSRAKINLDIQAIAVKSQGRQVQYWAWYLPGSSTTYSDSPDTQVLQYGDVEYLDLNLKTKPHAQNSFYSDAEYLDLSAQTKPDTQESQ